ncbi:MAG: hypothetical protein V3U76_01895 [Granulosicoccus sp.]
MRKPSAVARVNTTTTVPATIVLRLLPDASDFIRPCPLTWNIQQMSTSSPVSSILRGMRSGKVTCARQEPLFA